MPNLLEEFYGEDLNEYYYSGGYDNLDELSDEELIELYNYYVSMLNSYGYEDEEEGLYYNEEAGNVMYYSEDVFYYQEEPEIMQPNMYFKKEVIQAPKAINTQRDAQGSSWDANSVELDNEIIRIAEEEGVDYATAYRMFGQRYSDYTPDLSKYVDNDPEV